MDVHCSWTHNIRGLIWQQEKIGGTHIKCEFDGKIGDRKSVGGKKVKKDKKEKVLSELWEIEKLQKVPWLFLFCSHRLHWISFRFPLRQWNGSKKEDEKCRATTFFQESRFPLHSSEPWKMLGCLSVPVNYYHILPVEIINALCWKCKIVHGDYAYLRKIKSTTFQLERNVNFTKFLRYSH